MIQFIKRYYFIILISACLVSGTISAIIKISKEKTRLSQDYKAANAPITVTKKSDATIYTHPVETITMGQFKDVFQKEFEFLKKDLGLKALQSVANVNTETIKNITTSVRDTLIHDTVHAKTWTYEDKSLQIRAIEVGQIRQTSWKHTLELTLVTSKQPRVGIKKLFIWKPRPLIYNVIPSDTNTIITNLRERIIK